MKDTTKTDIDTLIKCYYDSTLSLRQNASLISEKSGITVGKDRVSKWLKKQNGDKGCGAEAPATMSETKSKQPSNHYWSADKISKAINRITMGVSQSENSLMTFYVLKMCPIDYYKVRRAITNEDNQYAFDVVFRKWYDIEPSMQ